MKGLTCSYSEPTLCLHQDFAAKTFEISSIFSNFSRLSVDKSSKIMTVLEVGRHRGQSGAKRVFVHNFGGNFDTLRRTEISVKKRLIQG
jgi:hypothetical protein